MTSHLISISEMAKLHGITRQTLIHYDSIGLFKPAFVDDKGYRYYSRRQIPLLREICFLSTLGISLKDITAHLLDRDPNRERELLEQQKKKIIKEIIHLGYLRDAITHRMRLYEEASAATEMTLEVPFIQYFEEPRRVIFKSFDDNVDREQLHLTLMELWRELFHHELLPSRGFGTILQAESLISGDYLKNAGSYIIVSSNASPDLFNCDCIDIAPGYYACMYKYGMPYEMKYIKQLLRWIADQHMTVNGPAIDACLLDTTFYKQDVTTDFCFLQIPVHIENPIDNGLIR
jgi:DNA-binding transcriptional MerR regulator